MKETKYESNYYKTYVVDMSKMLIKTKLNSKAHNRYRMKFMKTLEHENVE